MCTEDIPVLVILIPNAVLCDIIVFSIAIAAKYAGKPRGYRTFQLKYMGWGGGGLWYGYSGKNNKISPPWVDKYLCSPVIWSHIFHRSRSRPIFRSISLVDTKKMFEKRAARCCTPVVRAQGNN